MGTAAAGLVQVGHIGPYRMVSGVKEEGIQIREPVPTGQKGSKQEQGTKPATTRSDHVQTLRRGRDFVYCLLSSEGSISRRPSFQPMVISDPPSRHHCDPHHIACREAGESFC